MKQKPQPSNGKTKIFEQLCESLPDALLIVNKKGSIVQSNTLADAMFGYTEEELRSLSVEMLMPEQSRRLHHDHRSAYSVKPTSRMMGSGMRLRARRKDGTEFPVDIALGPIQSGEETMILCSIRDVSERHRMDEHIRKFSVAIEQTADCVIITDREGIIQYVNDAFEKETGYTREEAIGKTPRFLKSGMHDNKFYERLWKTILSGNVFRGVFINKRKDGNIIYEHKTITPLKDEKGEITHFVSTAKNITEQRLIEESLQRSEERYRELFETTGEVIHVLTPDGRFLFVNRAWRETLGYSEKEVENLLVEHIIHSDNTLHCDTIFRRVLAGEKIDRLETSFVTKDGKKLMLEGSIKCRFEAGVPQNITCFLQDVTERKQAETELRESEMRFRVLIEKSTDAITQVDATGTILYVSPAVEKIVIYSSEEMVGKKFDTFVHPDDLKFAQETFSLLLQEPTKSVSLQLRVRRKDGSMAWAEATATNFLNIPSVGSIVANYRDITERKRVENELRENEIRYRTIFTQSFEAIYLFDPDSNHIIEANPSFFRILGYTPEELPALTLHDIVAHTPEAIEANLKRALEFGAFDLGERVWRRKDGVLINVLVTLSVIEQNDKKLVYAVAHDITERNRATESLRERERQYSMLLGNLSGMAFRCKNDPEWKLEYISHGCLNLTGYSPEELLAQTPTSFGELVHPDDANTLWEKCQSSLARHTSASNIYRIITADKQIKWVWNQAQGVYSESGELLFVEGFITDVTESKRMEEQLLLAAHTLESISEITTITDIENRFVFCQQSVS